jgi:alpha-glucosidase (family GH31 glycosyl hydrolase)|tara:strand:- start:1098 stop:1679 length:582 start_codon:yes stop_codon:yes gene_type:complete
MGDRFSDWGIENGLGSIIPALLTSGVLGYPFCLPDIIGGNAYFGKHPDEELLVRWAQANALMPAMQFSLTPWAAGSMAKDLCISALEMRDQFVETLIDHSERAVETLEPICRPMWWLDPEDSETFRIGDQFALGEDIIVAPVTTRGANERAIYLTEGRWRDLSNGKVHQGRRWMRDFSAPIGALPIFIREKSS